MNDVSDERLAKLRKFALEAINILTPEIEAAPAEWNDKDATFCSRSSAAIPASG